MNGWAVELRAEESARDAVAVFLAQATGVAVEERADGILVGYAPTRIALDGLTDRLLRVFHDIDIFARVLEPVDWSERWREGLAARRVGRLHLTPSWLPRPEGDDLVSVVIDPEMAFGSGEHGSTRAALALLERAGTEGRQVLDLGSGSGVLAIAAARLGAARAVGIEIDAEAIPYAERNAESNGVADRVTFVEGDAGALAPLLGPADLILSNILRTVNVALLGVIRTALAAGGLVIFSGMEPGEAEEFLPALRAAGFQVVDEVVDTGWWALAARLA